MGSNLTKDDGLLWAIKIHSMTAFIGEVKQLAPCHKILQHVKDPCGGWQRYFPGKINRHFSLSFSLFH
jgi:hypothetical protein